MNLHSIIILTNKILIEIHFVRENGEKGASKIDDDDTKGVVEYDLTLPVKFTRSQSQLL